jgi:tRNA-binding protein
MTISLEDFRRVDIRVGTIINASNFAGAHKPAYQLLIYFGPEIGELQSSAQIKALYSQQDLINRQVMAVVNLPPKQIADFLSECLVLGFDDTNGDIVLAEPERAVPDGTRMH